MNKQLTEDEIARLNDLEAMCARTLGSLDEKLPVVFMVLTTDTRLAFKAQKVDAVLWTFPSNGSKQVIDEQKRKHRKMLRGARVVVVVEPDEDLIQPARDVGRDALKIAAEVYYMLPMPTSSDQMSQGLEYKHLAKFHKELPLVPIIEQEQVEAPLDDVLKARRLSEVKTEAIEWFWPGRIPRGKVSIVAGDGNASKSSLAIWQAAQASKVGSRWPAQQNNDGEIMQVDEGAPVPHGTTILISCEDSVGNTIRPRFMAAGGNDEKMIVIESTLQFDEEGNAVERMFSLKEDLRHLERLVKREKDVVLVIVDPLNSYLGTSAQVDSWKDQDIRSVLAPFAMLAEKYNFAAEIITHNTKDSKQSAIARIMGSAGVANICRTIATVIVERDEFGVAKPEHRIFVQIKWLSKEIEAPGLYYQLVDVELPSEGEGMKSFTCRFDGRTTMLSADALMAIKPIDSEKRKLIDRAVGIIEKHLDEAKARGTLAWSSDIEEELSKNGLTKATIGQAQRELGVVPHKELGQAHGKWFWCGPNEWFAYCQKQKKKKGGGPIS